MSIFRNKILTKMIATLCIVLVIINFGISNKVYADWEGILITPITNLLTSIADGIMAIMQQVTLNQEITIIEISGTASWWDSWGEKLAMAVITVVVVVVVAAAIVASAGGLAPLAAGGMAAFATGAKIVAYSAIAIIGAGLVNKVTVTLWDGTPAELVAESLGDWWFEGNLYMPAFSLTPQEIFSNKILLFDVNFFNPNEDEEYETPAVISGLTVPAGHDLIVTGTYSSSEGVYGNYDELDKFIHCLWNFGLIRSDSTTYEGACNKYLEKGKDFAAENKSVEDGVEAFNNLLRALNDAIGKEHFHVLDPGEQGPIEETGWTFGFTYNEDEGGEPNQYTHTIKIKEINRNTD